MLKTSAIISLSIMFFCGSGTQDGLSCAILVTVLIGTSAITPVFQIPRSVKRSWVKEVCFLAETFPFDDYPSAGKFSWKSHISFQLVSH